MVDPISDMLTRIRNAQAVGHTSVNMPYSKLKHSLAKLLEKEGYLGSINVQGKKAIKVLEIELKYEKGQKKINVIKRISKPGQRVYKKAIELRPIQQGYGMAIISTSQGLVTNKEAKKKGLGGEVLCELY